MLEHQSNSKLIPKFSVAKAILAVLWRNKEGTVKLFHHHPYFQILCRGKNKKTCLSALSRLKKTGHIGLKGSKTFFLTQEGREPGLLAFINAEINLNHNKKHRWDGKWRMVFFDIPEHSRYYRDYLRKLLKVIGFKEFQKSIWIYPYQAPSSLKHLLLQDTLKKHVRFITTEHIDNDYDLRKAFSLVENV